ncbi:sodium:solute symporter family transporter [Candidatus Lariskella endosymbiont of Epinotia ramella]|uniref:sodium:solute symporter family protein n=1 Tax=Candidatus Lariskella endosymbiont of Epinotia ramella TaxID=3066224 RepID=UPI0030CBDDED
MHIIDITIVITYLIVCIFIGLYKSKSITTLKEYTLGGGYFSNLVISTTLFCTYIGASETIGVVGQISIYGVFFIIPLFLSPIAWLMMAQVYGKNISKFHGCLSISDIMERLYGKAGKWVTNIVTLSLAVVVTTTQSTAIGVIANYYFAIPVLWGTAIGALTVAFYSATGGIRAVALTDAFQFAVLIIAIPVACSYIYHDVGGYSGIVNSLPKEMLRLDINMDNIALFLSLIVFNLVPETSGTFVQRFLMSKGNAQLTKCLRLVAAIHLPFLMFICVIGLCVKIKAHDIQPRY